MAFRFSGSLLDQEALQYSSNVLSVYKNKKFQFELLMNLYGL